MKKKLIAAAVTVLLCLSFVFSASALSADEALVRKRAYYSGINNTVLLLSNNLGDLSNVQVKRIIVTSHKDFTSEEAVKDAVVSESLEFISTSSVGVAIQFSARDGSYTRDYIFNHFLSAGNSFTLTPLASSNITTSNYNSAVSYLNDSQKFFAPGIAYVNSFGDSYFLDIDLSDYQRAGHSLTLPLPSSSADTTVSLFPLIRKRAYYSGINSTVSLLSKNLGNLRDVQVERIVVASRKDFTSEEAVKENVEQEASAFLSLYTIDVSIQFSASNGSSVQDYLFHHYLPASSVYTLAPMSSPTMEVKNYKNGLSYLSNYGYCIAPGIAYLNVLTDSYYLDIDLTDYQSMGYSLTIPA